jgi:hypothetical protein
MNSLAGELAGLDPNDPRRAEIVQERKTRRGTTIQCLLCGLTSYNPNDVKYRHCRKCRVFHNRVEVLQESDLRKRKGVFYKKGKEVWCDVTVTWKQVYGVGFIKVSESTRREPNDES